MSKNIVICCDGTSNEIRANLSNVLKLFRTLRKNDQQIVFYDPGVGTLNSRDPWSRFRSKAYQVFGLATGHGLDQNILDAYRFLVDTYVDGDRIYLFGFSRGAYTARALAGCLRLVGLLAPPQKNLSDYALVAYKRVAERGDFEIAGRFARVASTRLVPVKFVGVWDTVSSVIVPRPDRFYIPSLQKLPFTRTNSQVEVFRQAIAIDERRRMFRLNRWVEPQEYKPNPFDASEPVEQDIKQVWFCGSHSDVGGGYPEAKSGLAKYPLQWMIDEAERHGLLINRSMYNHLVLGRPREGSKQDYVAPDFKAPVHDSMTWGWLPLEWIPKRAKWREWPKRAKVLGLYLPQREPRVIADHALIHHSVVQRMDAVETYRPVNLPPRDRIRIEEPALIS